MAALKSDSGFLAAARYLAAIGQPAVIPVADDFLRRESDQREDGLRRAAFHPEKSNRLKYNSLLQTLKDSRRAYKVNFDFFDGHVAGVAIDGLVTHNVRDRKCRYEER